MCVQDIEKVDEAMEPTMGLTEQQEQKVWPLPSSEFLNTQIDNFDTKTLSPQTNSSPDIEKVDEAMEPTMGLTEQQEQKVWPLPSSEFLNTQIDNFDTKTLSPQTNSSPLESINENKVVMDNKQNQLANFVLELRSGEWAHIGSRDYMEDTHVCIADMAKKFGQEFLDREAVSFFGVFDGHGGKDAAHFVRDNLPRVIVEDANFPLELEKVVIRSFAETDVEFAKTCSIQSSLSSGTTALTAMIFGRSLLVANVGDCRAVLSRLGVAVEMSRDHRPCCTKERNRIESLGGYIDDGYLNGQLGVTRAFGNWHIEGMKEIGEQVGPLSAEPELKLITLTKDDEFLIIATDGVWDVFTSQNAIDFARRKLQEHNNVKQVCKEMGDEAIKRGALDNLTIVMVCFHPNPPSPVLVHNRSRFRRSISVEGLQSLKSLLEG